MLTIGVVSDSHNDLPNLKKSVDLILGIHEADLLVHLGDDYGDTFQLDIPEERLFRVPGVYSEFYQDRRIDKRVIKVMGQWRVLLTHTPGFHQNDPPDAVPPEVYIKNGKVDMVLYGHTHKPEIRRDDQGIVWFNPGHIVAHDRRGFLSSFGVLKIEEHFLTAQIFDLTDGHLLMCDKFEKQNK